MLRCHCQRLNCLVHGPTLCHAATAFGCQGVPETPLGSEMNHQLRWEPFPRTTELAVCEGISPFKREDWSPGMPCRGTRALEGGSPWMCSNCGEVPAGGQRWSLRPGGTAR